MSGFYDPRMWGGYSNSRNPIGIIDPESFYALFDSPRNMPVDEATHIAGGAHSLVSMLAFRNSQDRIDSVQAALNQRHKRLHDFCTGDWMEGDSR